ncbi:MAG: ABC-2 family transporter protein [Anaerolineaceae bacterium]|nr:MAG: ABC-2 family transporter protein [Anaerolineaceae bacterium]
MRSAFVIYLRLIAANIRAQLGYPVSFLLEATGTGLILSMWFISLVLIFQRFEHIAGWTLGEVAFLYGLIEMAFGTMDMIFSGFDPHFFGSNVRRGGFDKLLLRPEGLTVQVLGSSFVFRRLGRIIQGVVIFIIALSMIEVSWTPAKILYLPVVFISLICFFGGLFIIGSTITFWTVESIEVINILTYGGSEMMSYPMHIYQDWMRRFFTFIVPAIFLNYYPALYFLDKPALQALPSFAPFLSPMAGFGVLLLALRFWRFGIRHYQSTGT